MKKLRFFSQKTKTFGKWEKIFKKTAKIMKNRGEKFKTLCYNSYDYSVYET